MRKEDNQESVFDTLDKSNAQLLSETSINHHLKLAYWANNQDRVSYNADNVHTLSFYLQGGEGSRRMDANCGTGHQGSLCLLPQFHQSVWEITAPFKFAHLYFTDEALKQFASTTLDIEPRLIQVPELTFHEDPALEVLTRELFLFSDENRLNYEQSTLKIFEHLLSDRRYCFSSAKTALTGGLSPVSLKRVKDYIHQNFSRNISIKELAQLVNMSDFHLLRMFKVSTGFTPNDYLNYVRVEAAMSAIAQGKALIDIAHECGFSNQSHLNRVFKKWKGVTPGYYRNEIAGKK